MSLDKKTIVEIADQLGIKGGTKVSSEKIRAWENRSDEELVNEILKVKERLSASNVSYEKQMAAVKSLMPMMDEQQKSRLSKIISLLESK